MSYKMIVLDLDGTLMSSKNEILPKTKEALFKAQEQGVMIVLASGRPTYGMVKAAKELRLDEYPGYILSYNGGRIISVQTDELIYDKSLTPEICHELYDLSREMNVNIMAYEDEAIITADDDQYIQKEAHINGMPINRVENFKDSVTFNSVKCLCTAEPEYLAQVEIKMKERLGVQDKRPLADFLPTLTIAAKNLATEMTNYNVEEKDLQGETAITVEHVENNTSVRDMLGQRGIKPENLPASEDIKKLERRVKREEKKLAEQSGKLTNE